MGDLPAVWHCPTCDVAATDRHAPCPCGWKPNRIPRSVLLESVLREFVVDGAGPRAHTECCAVTLGRECDCRFGRARRLLGMEER